MVRESFPTLRQLFSRMKQFFKPIFAALVLAATVSTVAAQNILPKSFAGWTQTGDVKTITNPEQADAAYSGVLNEYGFVTAETATYTS